MKTRLQEVAMEFIIADEALRKALIREETTRKHLGRVLKLFEPKQPKRIEVMGKNGREVWSLPIR